MPRITHTIVKTWKNKAAGVSLAKTAEADGDVEINLGASETIAAGAVNVPYAVALTQALITSIFWVASQALVVKFNGTDEEQELSTTGTVTAGTFTATWNGQTTAAVVYTTTAANFQAKLEALSNIEVGDVLCTGGPLPATPIQIKFRQNLAATNVAAITTTDTLTGGSTAVATTTAGVAASQTLTMVAGVALEWQAGYYTIPINQDVTRILLSNPAAGSSTFQFKTLLDGS